MHSLNRPLRTALLLLLAAAPLFAQSSTKDELRKDDLFAGTDRFAQGAKEASEVNLDKKMLGMMQQFNSDDKKTGDKTSKDQLDLAKKMDFVYVRSYEYEKPGGYKPADLDAFRARLETGDWTHVVKERSPTEQSDVWIRTDNEGQFTELVVISAEPTELSFVHLKGHMSMKDLTQAGAKYGAPQPTAAKLQRRPK